MRMPGRAAAAACLMLLLGSAPASSQQAPVTVTQANQVANDTLRRLDAVRGRSCQDSAVRDALSRANEVYAQVSSVRVREFVSGFPEKMSDAEFAPLRRLDRNISAIAEAMAVLEKKPACPQVPGHTDDWQGWTATDISGLTQQEQDDYRQTVRDVDQALRGTCIDPKLKEKVLKETREEVERLVRIHRSSTRDAYARAIADRLASDLLQKYAQLEKMPVCPSPGEECPPPRSKAVQIQDQMRPLQQRKAALESRIVELDTELGTARTKLNDADGKLRMIAEFNSGRATRQEAFEQAGIPVDADLAAMEKQAKKDKAQAESEIRELERELKLAQTEEHALTNELNKLEEEKNKALPEVGFCPSERTDLPTGTYVSLELLKNTGRTRTTESFADDGGVTNRFDDSGDPLGAGIVVGHNFAIGNGRFAIGPFMSADWLRQTINHNFAGGTFIGTTTNWMLTTGVKAGVMAAPNVFVYGLGGVSWLNENLNINFGGPVTSGNTIVPGITLGLGGEMRPTFLQQLGRPVSLFLQYQHTWWDDAHLNQPAASPFFNYAFARQDDTVKFGVTVYLHR